MTPYWMFRRRYVMLRALINLALGFAVGHFVAAGNLRTAGALVLIWTAAGIIMARLTRRTIRRFEQKAEAHALELLIIKEAIRTGDYHKIPPHIMEQVMSHAAREHLKNKDTP